MTQRKPIICLDFDGVIHSYEHGWQGGKIYGTLTPGFIEWASEARKHFQLAIFSSHSPEGTLDMATWLANQLAEVDPEVLTLLDFSWPATKPPAFVSIDDRAITFNGDWKEFSTERLLGFRSWTS